jgi:hypothetical protein
MSGYNNNTNKTIGTLFIAGAIGIFVPYTILTAIFDYPDVLRQDTATVLLKFDEGGGALIWTWFAFAITGLPLLPAYILLGRMLERKTPLARIATTMGVIGLIIQMIGLLRWTFVVPVLADTFVSTTDEITRTAAIVAFDTIHQFAGVMLGEHLGQLFTIAWTVMIAMALRRLKAIPAWVSYLAYVASGIYVFAQAELFATVIPSFPVWELAGFLGSTLWLMWLVILGIYLLRTKGLLDFNSQI